VDLAVDTVPAVHDEFSAAQLVMRPDDANSLRQVRQDVGDLTWNRPMQAADLALVPAGDVASGGPPGTRLARCPRSAADNPGRWKLEAFVPALWQRGEMVDLSINGRDVPLDFCSRSCRTADVTLAGGEHVDVVADGSTGGTVSFALPSLPAPDGSELLQQVQDRMHRLQTLRSHETLGPVVPPIETQYAFQVPDRMQMDISNGSHTIFIGGTRYTRNDQSNAG